MNRQTLELAKRRDIPIRTYPRAEVIEFFKEFGATTKQRIAEAIAKHIPALSLYVPPPRKPWKSEDARMGIFDAAGLAWLFIHSDNKASSECFRRCESVCRTRNQFLSNRLCNSIVQLSVARRPNIPKTLGRASVREECARAIQRCSPPLYYCAHGSRNDE